MFTFTIISALFAVVYLASANIIIPYEYLEEIEPQSYLRERREIDYNDVPIYEPIKEFYPEHYRVRRQAFGGVNRRPGGGGIEMFGYRFGSGWGSLSQSFDNRGFGTPITYTGGVDHISPAEHGLSGTLSAKPGIGDQGNIRGQLGLLNTPNHQVTAWGQHDRNFNKDFKPIGPATNSAGLNYLNKDNGAGAFVKGSQTPGLPKSGSIGGNYPLINNGNTRLDATAQSNFAQGMKPNHEVGLQLKQQF